MRWQKCPLPKSFKHWLKMFRLCLRLFCVGVAWASGKCCNFRLWLYSRTSWLREIFAAFRTWIEVWEIQICSRSKVPVYFQGVSFSKNAFFKPNRRLLVYLHFPKEIILQTWNARELSTWMYFFNTSQMTAKCQRVNHRVLRGNLISHFKSLFFCCLQFHHNDLSMFVTNLSFCRSEIST